MNDSLRVSPDSASSPARGALLLVFGVAALAYVGTLFADFTNWDDPSLVLENPVIRGFSWRNFVAWWSIPYFGAKPLSEASYALDYHFWGLRPAGFHLTNILLHGLCTVLVWRLSYAFVANSRAATLAAFIFALHPASVEAVAWVSQRRTLLAAPFMVAALLAYLRAEGAGAWKAGLLCVLFFIGALFSKNVAVAPFPVLLLILHRAPGVQFTKARLVVGLVSLGAAVVTGALRLYQTANLETFRGLLGGSVSSHASAIAVEVGKYFAKLLFPVRLSPYYDLRQEDLTPAAITLGVALAAAVLLTILRLVFRRRRAGFFAAGALLFWLPSSGVLVPFAIPAADRYLYLPLLFLSPLVAIPVERLARTSARRAVPLMTAAILVMMGILTVCQSTYWHSSFRLWSRAVEVEPRNPWVRQKLAYTLWVEGDARAALAHAKVAAAVAPHWLEGLETLGRVALDAGEPGTAEAAFRQQIGIAPRAVNAYVGLARARSALGDDEEALHAYIEALRLKRDLESAARGVYELAVKNGREEELLSALPRAPTSVWIDLVRGDLLARMGRAEEAEELWRKILLARPGFEPAMKRLSPAGEARGQRNELTGAAPSE